MGKLYLYKDLIDVSLPFPWSFPVCVLSSCMYPSSCPCSSTLASSMSSCCFDSASSLHQDCGDRRLSLHTHLCGEDPERSGVYVGAVPRTAHRAATPHTLQQHRRRLRLLRYTVCDVAAAFHGWVCAVVLMFSSLLLLCCFNLNAVAVLLLLFNVH